MILNADEIRNGLREECSALPDWISLQALELHPAKGLIRVKYQVESRYGAKPVIDESLEGAKAWWTGHYSGQAKVLAVQPEDGTLILTEFQGAPLRPGERLRIYPQDFLKALLEIWADPFQAKRALSYCGQLSSPEKTKSPWQLPVNYFPHLRSSQKKAIGLLDHNVGFLWGPPGTGKTTTLGCVLATALLAKPQIRVLLLATTNKAVDQALLSVDDALNSLGKGALRKKLCRVGTRFDPQAYEARDHLIPIYDPEILALLRDHAKSRPVEDASETDQMDWIAKQKKLEKMLADQVRGDLEGRRLAALTVSKACHDLALLETLPFDVVVFDEASQLGIASVLPLLHLAPRVLFAGDPCQLSPIVKSKESSAQKALGNSPFDCTSLLFARNHIVRLSEQSRMAEGICRVVGGLAYDDELRVAADALQSASWASRRALVFSDSPESENVHVVHVQDGVSYSRRIGGNQRQSSAQKIAEMVAQALALGQVSPHEILILTPYRAQRVLIKKMLQEAKVRGVKVSTVHSSQGSEALVVIFDPVKGGDSFLCDEGGKRLMTVAFSRAQAKLVLTISPADTLNPYLAPIIRMKACREVKAEEVVSLATLLASGNNTTEIKGTVVKHFSIVGEIVEYRPEIDRVSISCQQSGCIKNYSIRSIC